MDGCSYVLDNVILDINDGIVASVQLLATVANKMVGRPLELYLWGCLRNYLYGAGISFVIILNTRGQDPNGAVMS